MRACKSSGFDFGSHWLKWHEFCWPIINHRAKQCKAKTIYFQHSTENCSSPSHQLLMFLRKIIKQVLRVNFRNIRNSVAQAKCLMPEKLVLYRSDLITIHKNETQSYRFNLRSMITILPNIVLSAVKSTSDPNFLWWKYFPMTLRRICVLLFWCLLSVFSCKIISTSFSTILTKSTFFTFRLFNRLKNFG